MTSGLDVICGWCGHLETMHGRAVCREAIPAGGDWAVCRCAGFVALRDALDARKPEHRATATS